MSDDLLISEEAFLTSGVHIGTQQKSADMMDFIYKVRNDGLYVLDIKKTNDRIRIAAQFLAKYDPKDILVVSSRQYGQTPVRMFSKIVGSGVIPGRFIPGRLTNPMIEDFIEPSVIVVTDPAADSQTMKEAISIGIPVVALCDANNETKYVDLVIPGNNKGRKSLALIYYLLTREILKERNVIENNNQFLYKVEDFEATL